MSLCFGGDLWRADRFVDILGRFSMEVYSAKKVTFWIELECLVGIPTSE